MLGDITPPRSYLMGNNSNSATNAPASSGGGGLLDPSRFGGAAGDAGVPVDGNVGGGGRRGGGSGGGGGGAAAAAPGVLSVIVGLPFRLLGKVISYALSPINYVLGVEEQPKDGSAAARRFVNKFEAEVGGRTRQATLPQQERKFFFLSFLRCADVHSIVNPCTSSPTSCLFFYYISTTHMPHTIVQRCRLRVEPG